MAIAIVLIGAISAILTPIANSTSIDAFVRSAALDLVRAAVGVDDFGQNGFFLAFPFGFLNVQQYAGD